MGRSAPASMCALSSGRDVEYRGREVILCTGAIHSPAHLLRAGIGPAGDLRALGIDVRVNLPGVGARLMDHPSIALASFIPQAGEDGWTPDAAAHPRGDALFVGAAWRAGR